MSSNRTKTERFNRRQLISLIGASGAAAVAGCLGDDEVETGDDDDGVDLGDEDDEDRVLGERVPDIGVEYWSDIGNTSRIMEQSINMMAEDYDDIGINLDIRPTEFTAAIGNAVSDARTSHISFWTHSSAPDRLDPDELVGQFSADKAGPDGGNPANYANCEYSGPALAQARATSEDERRELVNEAQRIGAEDAYISHVHPRVTMSTYYPDRMEANGIGEAGMDQFINPNIFLKSESIEGDTIATRQNPPIIETTNYLSNISPTVVISWSNLVNSPLVMFDENFDRVNVLAETIEEGEDGHQLTVELRDATFHNGDPITAEAVKWTFELLQDNRDDYPIVVPQPYESIDVIDDTTVEFNFEEPSPAIFGNTFSRWGILHPETWEGARESPIEFAPDDPLIGSGPFEIDDYEIGQFLRLRPSDQEHPLFNPDHNVLLQVFAEAQAQNQAFISGELDFISGVTPAALEDIQDRADGEVEVVETGEFVGFYLFPHHPQPPIKFKAFRQAIDMAYSRQRIHDTVFRGGGFIQTEPTAFTQTHPWFPEDGLPTHTDDPTGDQQGAIDVLREAGFGWDDNDVLHYPPDADLTPLWREGQNPTSDDGFACLDEDGNYVG